MTGFDEDMFLVSGVNKFLTCQVQCTLLAEPVLLQICTPNMVVLYSDSHSSAIMPTGYQGSSDTKRPLSSHLTSLC